jgi:hypothetical protein
MANTLAGRVWAIDSTGVLSLYPMKVKSILAGTTLTLKDNRATPNTVFSTAAAGYFPDVCEWFPEGLQVTTASGVSYLYLE